MKLQVPLVAVFLAAVLGAPGAWAADAAAAKSTAPESFQVRNKKFGDLLRPEDANGATGTRIVLHPAQPWKCMTWKFYPAGEFTFELQNHFTSKTFAADSTAGQAPLNVTQVPFAKEPGQRPKWQITRLADGTCRITDPKTGRALTAVKKEDEPTARIVTEPWREADEQKWEVLKTDPAKLTM